MLCRDPSLTIIVLANYIYKKKKHIQNNEQVGALFLYNGRKWIGGYSDQHGVHQFIRPSVDENLFTP